MSWRFKVRTLARRLGYDITPFDVWHSSTLRRSLLLKHHQINCVLDVGANIGLYALELRKEGFQGRIVSFEPLASVYAKLQQQASTDPKWGTRPWALGDTDGTAEINVAGNLESSSLLDMLPRHEEAAPEARIERTETIEVRRLDSVFESLVQPDERVFLKLDTQGYERTILEGAAGVLPRIAGVQVEMSLEPLYAGEMMFTDMIGYMQERGFALRSMESGFSDGTTGQQLQVDGLFFRA